MKSKTNLREAANNGKYKFYIDPVTEVESDFGGKWTHISKNRNDTVLNVLGWVTETATNEDVLQFIVEDIFDADDVELIYEPDGAKTYVPYGDREVLYDDGKGDLESVKFTGGFSPEAYFQTIDEEDISDEDAAAKLGMTVKELYAAVRPALKEASDMFTDWANEQTEKDPHRFEEAAEMNQTRIRKTLSEAIDDFDGGMDIIDAFDAFDKIDQASTSRRRQFAVIGKDNSSNGELGYTVEFQMNGRTVEKSRVYDNVDELLIELEDLAHGWYEKYQVAPNSDHYTIDLHLTVC